MKKLFTQQGDEILVDDEDYVLLSRFHFHTTLDRGTRKRPTVSINSHTISVQNLILGFTGIGKTIDHIDRNPFNNQKENLRICTYQENSFNRCCSKSSKSKYKGVGKQRNNYRATIYKNGRRMYLGTFSSAKEAAIAYDQKAKELFGEFAFLNFPNG